MANIDFTDEDGDRIQFSDAADEDSNETTEVSAFHPGSLPGVTVYGGEHHDYRGGTWTGPFIGKQVNR